jgi:3-phosphoshikimate 1-carboxyvinyltransferase
VRARIVPGASVGGTARVPGDKSIAHRWLILATTAIGSSRIEDLPPALDVLSTARVLAALAPGAARSLDAWRARVEVEGGDGDGEAVPPLEVEGSGRGALVQARGPLDCENSGTTLRLVCGVLASSTFESVLTGDDSLLRRPMERVAAPLRAMGAQVTTNDGRPPVRVFGNDLVGIRWRPETPSAQVKGAILLAGLAADGRTTVEEAASTRDHTERALEALGGPVVRGNGMVSVERFQQGPVRGKVPGDVSSAAYLAAGAILTGGRLVVEGVGLNPTRTWFTEVLRRMGAEISSETGATEIGEPVGALVAEAGHLRGTTVTAAELPLVIDEVPILALVAAHGEGETRFAGAGELRVKESDRLQAVADGIRELGGDAAVEGDALVVEGGGLRGGDTDSRGDHRLAMAFAVGALAARGECVVEGIECAAVSFPGFASTLAALGAPIDVEGR